MPDYFKNLLRQNIRKVRNNLSHHYQTQASNKICTKIQQHSLYHDTKHLGIYRAIGGEINLESLWQASLTQGKLCYFPTLTANKSLIFLPATPTTPFRTNRYNILEPDVDPSEAIAIQDLDILFLPLVAFDKYGTRLGMGAGYYDRALAQQKPQWLIGVAHDFQYQTLIIPEKWDIALHATITPDHLFWSIP